MINDIGYARYYLFDKKFICTHAPIQWRNNEKSTPKFIIIIAIDEPENNLHPYAFRVFLRRAERWAQKYELTILLATHSIIKKNKKLESNTIYNNTKYLKSEAKKIALFS